MRRRQIKIIILYVASILFASCENEIEKINLYGTDENRPDVMGENIEVIYSDSARVKVQMHAPMLLQFNRAEKPYSEFTQGLTVYFYDDSLEIESEIRSDYAHYDHEEKLWHATGNVVARNLKTGERLDSEELFWDEEKESIYSNTFTRIQNENGTFYGENGFKSNQSMTQYTLIGSRGVVNLQDDE
jgi:LPS export ABC transporter protein LptC